jgi:cytochrome c oxidase subunit IV
VPEHIVSTKVYAIVCVFLLSMTAVTWYMGRLNLGPWSIPVALSIATFKASLVALLFMDLSDSSRPVQGVAAAGLAWLAILLATLTDYFTRL